MRRAPSLVLTSVLQLCAACGASTSTLDVTSDADTTFDATVADASADAVDAAIPARDAAADAPDADATSGSVCGRPCRRTTCAEQGAVCGAVPDECGGVLQCGDCPTDRPYCSTFACSAQPPTCAPRTCAQWNAHCGQVLDGCGGLLNCGACPAGLTCGAIVPRWCDPCSAPPTDGGASADATVVSVCGRPCTPKTCADFPPTGCAAALLNDGCGGTVRCPATETCGGTRSCCGPSGGACYAPYSDSAPSACGTFCVPITCSRLGPDACGLMGDGCGGLLDCGGCAGGRACTAGVCGACPGDAG